MIQCCEHWYAQADQIEFLQDFERNLLNGWEKVEYAYGH